MKLLGIRILILTAVLIAGSIPSTNLWWLLPYTVGVFALYWLDVATRADQDERRDKQWSRS